MVFPAPILRLAQSPLEERLRPVVGDELVAPILERLLGAAEPSTPRAAGSQEARIARVLQGMREVFDRAALHTARRPLDELDALFGGAAAAEGTIALPLVPPSENLLDELERWPRLVPDERTAAAMLRQIGLARGLDWHRAEELLVEAFEHHLLAPDARTDALSMLQAVMRVHALLDVCFLALVHAAWSTLHQDLRRPFIALDAGRTHHTILARWRDLPKGGTMRVTTREGFAEILSPDAGSNVALRLDVHEIPMRLIEAIRHWRSWHGLRHWAALQRLLTRAGRTGRIRWTLNDHMDALGLSARARREPRIRSKIALEVEALTRLEIAVYNQDGTLRLRGPILAVTQRGEALRGSEWALEGLELVIHPVLYEGVRKDSGELGTLWAPAPAELAHIDERMYPYALALGLILPIRWRWDQADDRLDHLVLTGEKLLKTAGIQRSTRNPSRCWTTLDRNLRVLQEIGGVGEVEWEPGERNSLNGRCRISPPNWVRDRLVHRLQPREEPPNTFLLTGTDLVEWRRSLELTQAELARHLHLSERTIRRAEALSDQPLTAPVREALHRFQKPGAAPETAV
jgi:hypothetical protein